MTGGSAVDLLQKRRDSDLKFGLSSRLHFPLSSVLNALALIKFSSLDINGLVTDRNTKLCCRGFILALFQSTKSNKIDSEHTQDYKRLLPVCEAEILQVTVKRIEDFSSF